GSGSHRARIETPDESPAADPRQRVVDRHPRGDLRGRGDRRLRRAPAAGPASRAREQTNGARRRAPFVAAESSRAGRSAVIVVAAIRGREDLPGRVVAVLLGPEQPPDAVPEVRVAGADEPTDRRVTVGEVDAGDLVVVLVLAEAAVRGVDRGRGVAP